MILESATTMSLAITMGRQTWGFMGLLVVWALFMGVSRFLGELHRPGDILSGFVVGIVSGFVIRAGYTLIKSQVP